MTNQAAIKCISTVLDGTYTEGGACDLLLTRVKDAFPYFVPGKYHEALVSYRKAGFTSDLLMKSQLHTGNWLLFCDLLQGAYKISEVPAEGMEIVAEVLEITSSATVHIEDTHSKKENIAIIEVDEIGVIDTVPDDEILLEELKDKADKDANEQLGETSTEKQKVVVGEETLITPLVSFDYFLLKGEKVTDEVTFELKDLKKDVAENNIDKSLMVMMRFSEWLLHFKNAAERQQEETKDQKALKTMWQKEKLAAAMEEENEEIPENVFEMAVNSISREEGMASETLADIYIKQGKYDHAIEMYRKLSLQNPQKNAYFARKIEEALKNKET